MLLSAVSVLVVAQSGSEIPEGLMNNPVVQGSRLTPTYLPLILLSRTSGNIFAPNLILMKKLIPKFLK